MESAGTRPVQTHIAGPPALRSIPIQPGIPVPTDPSNARQMNQEAGRRNRPAAETESLRSLRKVGSS